MKTIVLFTNSYPFSKKGEYTFIEPELKILTRYFKVILVPLSKETDNPRKCIETFDNVTVEEIQFDKYKEIFKLFKFDPLLINELKNIKDLRQFKDLIIRYIKAKWIEKYVKHKLQEKKWSSEYIFYTYWFDVATTALINLKERFNLKVISRTHGYDLYAERRNGYIPFRNRDIKKIDKIFTISLHGYNYLKNKYNINNIENCYLGIEDYCVENPLNTANNEIKVVSCSLVVHVKRIDLIIKFLSQFSKEFGVKISWSHIGSGELEEEIKMLAAELEHGLFETKFVGYLENREIFNYYKNNSFDYFITLSKSEGLPVSLMEACSVGLPIIATNVGGIREIVYEERNGFLLSSDPEYGEFREKFLKAWKTKVDQHKFLLLRQNSRQIYEENFNAKKNFEKFAKKLKEL